MLADCVSNGQLDSHTCDELSSASGDAESSGEIMLFGVRVRVDPMRKSVSLNNLSQYEHLIAATTDNESMKAVVEVDDGYASADDAVPHRSSVESFALAFSISSSSFINVCKDYKIINSRGLHNARDSN
nr:transcription factor MYB1R1-like [Ipomoea trifida]